MKRIIGLSLVLLVACLFTIATPKVLAQEVEQDDCAPGYIVNEQANGCVEANAGGSCEANKHILGIPTWYKYLESEIDPTGRCSPKIENTAAALPIGIAVLEGALRLAGLVAVAMIFVASFRFITSEGNADNAAAARKTAINALIGLVIIILSTSIVSFIGNRLG